jgi:hypothetical protein
MARNSGQKQPKKRLAALKIERRKTSANINGSENNQPMKMATAAKASRNGEEENNRNRPSVTARENAA